MVFFKIQLPNPYNSVNFNSNPKMVPVLFTATNMRGNLRKLSDSKEHYSSIDCNFCITISSSRHRWMLEDEKEKNSLSFASCICRRSSSFKVDKESDPCADSGISLSGKNAVSVPVVPIRSTFFFKSIQH